MTINNKIRLGIIGSGNIGNVHMNIFKQLPEDVELVALTDINYPLAQKCAAEHGIPTTYVTNTELIEDPNIDAIVIGVPNQFHAPLAVQALRAGKHVLLEKPMAIDAKAAREIVIAQRETGKVLMIPHQMRWDWLPLQVKQQIDNGSIGKIYNAKVGWFRRKGIPGWGTWFTDHAQSGGGPLIDIGVHMLDLAFFFMGNAKPVSVFGSTYAEFGPKKRGIGTWGTPDWNGSYDVEDLATALIKMDDGSTLSLEVSWAVHMDTNSTHFIHLMGSEGGASIIGNKAKLLTETFERATEVELVTPEKDEGGRIRVSRHFIECIREGKQPTTSAMSGFTNNLILDAIYESSRTGHEVILDWNI
ncbi:Gfo/Idh/MocA family protein [Paenibacillus agricola]|uniref:Gfo/Idh/MocA family oxidoreductase n=1 Tax=Paenibacillus agricola TaxID=2716264 RepID=A0ABX0JGD3_9BACL|nr:Gfo/Idh/MocA family oxidoreductase [Paenibacillus agricola]NHN33957.1 Gfo/Idh/MocA family oxidoreductase [Paenibacillus agricola]